ncbi:hypothetical protein Gotur_010285 [Gossypium turneri]
MGNMEANFDKCQTILRTLVDNCLLENVGNIRVKMHDSVIDMGDMGKDRVVIMEVDSPSQDGEPNTTESENEEICKQSPSLRNVWRKCLQRDENVCDGIDLVIHSNTTVQSSLTHMRFSDEQYHVFNRRSRVRSNE